MKICFAVQRDDGIESVVFGHFGSAPAFIIMDTDDGEDATSVINRDRQHAHGACNPMQAIGGNNVDAVVVGGMGAGALMKLNSEGVKVFRAAAGSVRENLKLMTERKLPELTIDHTCAGHQGGCGHH